MPHLSPDEQHQKSDSADLSTVGKKGRVQCRCAGSRGC